MIEYIESTYVLAFVAILSGTLIWRRFIVLPILLFGTALGYYLGLFDSFVFLFISLAFFIGLVIETVLYLKERTHPSSLKRKILFAIVLLVALLLFFWDFDRNFLKGLFGSYPQ